MKHIKKPLAVALSLLLSCAFVPLVEGAGLLRPSEKVSAAKALRGESSALPTTSTPPDTWPHPEPTLDSEETPAPETTMAPMPLPSSPAPTPEPETTSEPAPPEESTLETGEPDNIDSLPHPLCSAMLSDTPLFFAEASDTLALALPIRYQHGDISLASNRGMDGEARPYLPESDALLYDQSLATYVREMKLILSAYQSDDCPIAIPGGAVQSMLLEQGVNLGYAVFEPLTVREDAWPGLYTLSVDLVWTDFVCGEEHVQTLEVPVAIEATKEREALIECICCVHCALCYDEAGERTSESCACVDEQGAYTGCACDAPCPLSVAEDADTPFAGIEEACACDCATEQIAPRSIQSPQGPIVFTFAELKAELARDGVSVIYLGYCDGSAPLEPGETVNNGQIVYPTTATTAAEIYLPASKQAVTIVGTDPRNGKRVTLVDNPVGLQAYTIHTMTNGQSITLVDADVVGNNVYGILSAATGHSNVKFRFENVTYAGAQMAWNYGSGSSVTFSDCDILIQDMQVVAQEVAEAREVILEGTNRITRQSSMNSAATYSMFWLHGTPNAIRVSANADITLQTTNYVIYNDAPANSASVLVESGASLDITTTGVNGCLSWQIYGVNDLTIRNGASLRLNHQNSAYNTLMFNELTVDPGGSLEIDRQVSNSNACIGTVGASPTMTVNNPASFVLRNESGRLFSSGTSPSYTLSAPVINLDVSGATRVWNNRTLDPFTVKGTPSTVSSTTAEGGYGASPDRIALSSANFSLNNAAANRLILGDYVLAIHPIGFGAPSVTGVAPGGSAQTITEYAFTGFPLGSPVQKETGVGGGAFQTGGSWQPLGRENVRVYAQSMLGSGLYALSAHTYQDAEPTMSMTVPRVLAFQTTALSNQDQMIDREDAAWAIQVLNGLPASGTWQLTARIAEPLHTPDYSDSLPGSLMLVEGDMTYPLLPGAPQLIAESPTVPAYINDIRWPQSEGILVFLPANQGRANVPYSTQIVWTLLAAP